MSTDRELTSGDDVAEALQYHEADLQRVARTLLGRVLRVQIDSVDLVQSVHRTILSGLRRERFRFSKPEDMKALAMTLLRRKIARHWRRMQRQQILARFVTATSVAAESDPQALAEQKDSVEHFLRKLPETDRQVIELRLLGLRTVEVADHLGFDSDVLRVRLSRLRQRLRERGMCDGWL